MKNIKGIIFDLDGVLLSTDRFHYLAWKKLADKLNINFTEKDNERLRGVSRMASLEIVLSLSETPLDLTDEEKQALAIEKNECYREFLKQLTPADITDEVRDTLKNLRDKGYKLAVGSSSQNTKTILAQTELTDAFEAVADGTCIINSKPDPEVFLKAAEFLGVDPEDCAVIEDAEAGLEAALRGGMLPIAYASALNCPLGKIKLEHFSDLSEIF